MSSFAGEMFHCLTAGVFEEDANPRGTHRIPAYRLYHCRHCGGDFKLEDYERHSTWCGRRTKPEEGKPAKVDQSVP